MNNQDLFDILQALANGQELSQSQLDNLSRQLRTDWIIDNFQATRRARIVYGPDANKEPNPPAGSVYMATDSKRLYCAYVAGTWEI